MSEVTQASLADRIARVLTRNKIAGALVEEQKPLSEVIDDVRKSKFGEMSVQIVESLVKGDFEIVPELKPVIDRLQNKLDSRYPELKVRIVLFGSTSSVAGKLARQLGRVHKESDVDMGLITNRKLDDSELKEIDNFIEEEIRLIGATQKTEQSFRLCGTFRPERYITYDLENEDMAHDYIQRSLSYLKTKDPYERKYFRGLALHFLPVYGERGVNNRQMVLSEMAKLKMDHFDIWVKLRDALVRELVWYLAIQTKHLTESPNISKWSKARSQDVNKDSGRDVYLAELIDKESREVIKKSLEKMFD